MKHTLEKYICILLALLFAGLLPLLMQNATSKLSRESAEEYAADELAWRIGCTGRVFLAELNRDYKFTAYDENGEERWENVIEVYDTAAPYIDFSRCRYVKVIYGEKVRWVRIR